MSTYLQSDRGGQVSAATITTVGVGVNVSVTACILAALASIAMTAPVRADVLEISATGDVQVRSGVGAVSWVSPSQPEAEPADGAPLLPAAAITFVSEPLAPSRWSTALTVAADRAGVSPQLLEAIVWQESRWQINAVSAKGAIGLTQLMPATARDMAINARDPAANLSGGARYLRQMLDRFGGNVELALAAYNAGSRRVVEANGVPQIAETRDYVSKIIDRVSNAATRLDETR